MKFYMGIMGSPPIKPENEKFISAVKKVLKTNPKFQDFYHNYTIENYLIIQKEAAFLYDAVKLYARALKKVLLNNENDAFNGTKIIHHLRNITYKSALGYSVYMCEDGDVHGNYTIVAMKTVKNVSGLYPIGQFLLQIDPNVDPAIQFDTKFPWASGKIPWDVPVCGFKGKKIKMKMYRKRIGNVANFSEITLATDTKMYLMYFLVCTNFQF